jgi:hypothetical protein
MLMHFFLFFVFHYLTYLYFCKKKGKERCYHWSLGDENSIATFWQQLEQHLLNYLSSRGMHYEEVKHCSKVIYDLTDLTGQNNRYNIDYIIDGATDAERKDARVFFSNLLTSELWLRKLPLFGSIEERRCHLKELKIISKAISRGEEGEEAALILISQAICEHKCSGALVGTLQGT